MGSKSYIKSVWLCTGHGTALGMVRSALEKGRKVHVYACETRPYNQVADFKRPLLEHLLS